MSVMFAAENVSVRSAQGRNGRTVRQPALDNLYFSVKFRCTHPNPFPDSMHATLVSTVICPNCHVELSSKAWFCSGCGTATCSPAGTIVATNRASSPPSRAGKPPQPSALMDRPWFIVVMLLHVGFLGIPLYWKTGYSAKTRMMICAASIAYTLFAVGVIGGVGWYLYQQVMSL